MNIKENNKTLTMRNKDGDDEIAITINFEEKTVTIKQLSKSEEKKFFFFFRFFFFCCFVFLEQKSNNHRK